MKNSNEYFRQPASQRRTARNPGPFFHLMRSAGLVWIAALLMLSGLGIADDKTGKATSDGDRVKLEFFEKQVRPLLVNKCYRCHSGTKNSGGLALDSKSGWLTGGENGAAIVPGKPAESLLIDAINYRSLEMPPEDDGGKLSAKEIGILEKWVATGALDPRTKAHKLGGMGIAEAKSWWAFQPLPDFDEQLKSETIDRLLEEQQTKKGLKPSPATDRRRLIRRVTYGLVGLPPKPEEVEAFVEDPSDEAFKQVIDRLLKSPQYGVHWGRHWLDIVRYADSAGENTDRPLPHAWRFRNWVIDALNDDLPYDQFVRMQLAGDLLADQEHFDKTAEDNIIATGYLAIARRFGHDIDKDIHLMYEDVIDNLGKSFLGLSLGCARCHDHKYDPITAQDYYALYGVFDHTRFSFPGCEPKGQPRDLIPLLEQTKVAAMRNSYEIEKSKFDSRKNEQVKLSQKLKQLAAKSYRVLATAKVGEGETQPFSLAADDKNKTLRLRKGEILQLTVLPNGNHGADTTRVKWSIELAGSAGKKWDVQNLIPKFLNTGPAISDLGATWCLLDVTDGPVFLHEKREQIDGKSSLKGWAIGGTPSSIVNDSKSPVAVFTTLPAYSFFVHPGVNRNVAVAWVCPEDGDYRFQGQVTDAHPAGLDGVSFRLEHFAEPQIGQGLLDLAQLTNRTPPVPPAFPVAYAVMEKTETLAEPRIHQRGDPEQLGEAVPRRWLEVFGGDELNKAPGSGRLKLANQVIAHPLFARVMVNRIWQWHFGKGLVATPNDFGSRGSAPSHPELLDRLAAHFQANGYRIKPIHRLILSTQAYQRSGFAKQELDVDNRWLAGFTRRRLTGEEIRDSIMFVTGNLDLSPGKEHPFPPASSWAYTQHNPFNAVYPTQRRSVFLMVQRQRRHPFLALFDGADPNSSTAVRSETTVPTQALYFLNDPFVHEQARLLATQVIQQEETHEKLKSLFQKLLQRDPTAEEKSIASNFLKSYQGSETEKWAAYCRVLLSSNEFIYVD